MYLLGTALGTGDALTGDFWSQPTGAYFVWWILLRGQIMTIPVINALTAISMGLREPSVGMAGKGSSRERLLRWGVQFRCVCVWGGIPGRVSRFKG